MLVISSCSRSAAPWDSSPGTFAQSPAKRRPSRLSKAIRLALQTAAIPRIPDLQQLQGVAHIDLMHTVVDARRPTNDPEGPPSQPSDDLVAQKADHVHTRLQVAVVTSVISPQFSHPRRLRFKPFASQHHSISTSVSLQVATPYLHMSQCPGG
ncbi:hypothetical protein K402DRAFT_400642 [Aulographum hederae CBS 113979]|uniref:Uncharacterized protein n=1 Tax=Aulographum hederae CBS 113979 TaxID=1176131 RepID=A0A6G1HDP5_9PEZI|nr:hypothetical protein K402DRAFT_400642 [Aulographum hederae CBS 113979]